MHNISSESESYEDTLWAALLISTWHYHLLLSGSEESGVLGVGSIPVAILPSCQDMKNIAL